VLAEALDDDGEAFLRRMVTRIAVNDGWRRHPPSLPERSIRRGAGPSVCTTMPTMRAIHAQERRTRPCAFRDRRGSPSCTPASVVTTGYRVSGRDIVAPPFARYRPSLPPRMEGCRNLPA